MKKIQKIAWYIINLYKLWKRYDEKNEIQDLLAKMLKRKAAPYVDIKFLVRQMFGIYANTVN